MLTVVKARGPAECPSTYRQSDAADTLVRSLKAVRQLPGIPPLSTAPSTRDERLTRAKALMSGVATRRHVHVRSVAPGMILVRVAGDARCFARVGMDDAFSDGPDMAYQRLAYVSVAWPQHQSRVLGGNAGLSSVDALANEAFGASNGTGGAVINGAFSISSDAPMPGTRNMRQSARCAHPGGAATDCRYRRRIWTTTWGCDSTTARISRRRPCCLRAATPHLRANGSQATRTISRPISHSPRPVSTRENYSTLPIPTRGRRSACRWHSSAITSGLSWAWRTDVAVPVARVIRCRRGPVSWRASIVWMHCPISRSIWMAAIRLRW